MRFAIAMTETITAADALAVIGIYMSRPVKTIFSTTSWTCQNSTPLLYGSQSHPMRCWTDAEYRCARWRKRYTAMEIGRPRVKTKSTIRTTGKKANQLSDKHSMV